MAGQERALVVRAWSRIKERTECDVCSTWENAMRAMKSGKIGKFMLYNLTLARSLT